jgi:hypothetical protein
MSSGSDASTVLLQWDPNTEQDLAGYKVYYSADSSPLAGSTPLDVQKQTTATISGLDPDKAYNLAVTAYNAAGQESSFSNVVTVAEQTPPTVSITSPANSSSVSGIVTINVNATDNVGVTKIEYYVNGQLISTDLATPYVYSWDTTSLVPGAYTIITKAYDAAGNISQSSSSVTVVNDLIAPTVAITSPANNATLSGIVTINAGASDNVGVSKVEFYSNSVLIFASNVAPYSFSWDTKAVANGGYNLIAKAFDNAGNISSSSTVTVSVSNIVPDVTKPIVSAFTLPATFTSLTVTVSGLTATDSIGITGYMITESATAPAASAVGWITTSPTTFTFTAEGSKTAYAWAKDAAGNVSASRSASVNITLPDIVAPTIGSFTMPVTFTSLTVPVSGLVATDTFGVTGYMITESAMTPAASAAGWSSTAPTSFNFTAAGAKSAYAWAKDAAGNVSTGRSASVTITLPDVAAPTLSSFTMPTTSASLTVPISGIVATDTIGVTGYMITESAMTPAASAAGWNTSAPTSFTFTAEGSKTAYAWAKDAAGNVSASRSATVTITLPDVAAPTLSSFTMPATSTSLTVPVSGLVAADTFGVTGYMITESATAPAATAAGWSATAPTSYTFSAEGAKTAYAWAKDAAGNVSAGRSAYVSILLPDITAPVVSIPSPFSGAIVNGTISVTVGVSDNVAVTKVEFYVNGNLKASNTSPPYSFNWDSTAVTNGAYYLTAKAYDAAGNIGQSSSVNVTVSNLVGVPQVAVDITPPKITFNSLSSKYIFGSKIIINASSTDNVAVAKMELYIDGKLQLGTNKNIINTSVSISKGAHVILVKAYDAAKNVSSSSKSVYRLF